MRDHARLCQGREYTCTCGYDQARDDLFADLVSAARCALGYLTGNMDGDMDLGDPVEMLRTAIAQVEDAA